MPRARKKENQGLPARWRFVHGAYYYEVPRGLESLWDGKKKFRLGGSLSMTFEPRSPPMLRAWNTLEPCCRTQTIEPPIASTVARRKLFNP